MRPRTWLRIYSGIFLLLLVGSAFFGAYSGTFHQLDDRADAHPKPSSNGWNEIWKDPSSVFTGIVALFTVGLFVVGARQLRAHGIAEQRQIRAYLSISAIDLEIPSLSISGYVPPTILPGHIFTDFVVLTVRNHGRTPASDVRTWAMWVFVPSPFSLPESFEFQNLDAVRPGLDGVVVSRRSLFPDAEYISKVAIVDATPFIQAHRRQVTLYLYGQINYRDVFGVPRVTNFCLVYEPWRPTGDQFTSHARHNDAT